MKRHTASLEAALANLKKTAKVTQVEDLLPKIVREKCKFVFAVVLLEWKDQRKHSHLQNLASVLKSGGGGGYSYIKAYGDVLPKWVTFSPKFLSKKNP